MKARHRKNREAGGGVAAYKEDLSLKNGEYNGPGARDVTKAAEERKRGGKTVKMQGKMSKLNAGRMPRKSGGRTGSNMNPLSSAHSGTPARGRSSKQSSC
jgi:hypothetical protein